MIRYLLLAIVRIADQEICDTGIAIFAYFLDSTFHLIAWLAFMIFAMVSLSSGTFHLSSNSIAARIITITTFRIRRCIVSFDQWARQTEYFIVWIAILCIFIEEIAFLAHALFHFPILAIIIVATRFRTLRLVALYSIEANRIACTPIVLKIG